MENERFPVVTWLHLEDREEYSDTYLDGSPITASLEIWKKVDVGPWCYGSDSHSHSVPLTDQDAQRLLNLTEFKLIEAVYALLGVNNTNDAIGLPEGPYYDVFNVDYIRHSIESSLRGELTRDKMQDRRGEAEHRKTIIAINDKLVERVLFEYQHDPDAIDRISSRAYEKLIAELLRDMGYDTELTPETHDNGRDILARICIPPSKPLFIIVECKKLRKDRPVEISDIRAFLYTLREHDHASGGMFCTTAYFTSGERRLVEEKWKYQLSLHDRNDLIVWLEKYGKWHMNGEGQIWVP